MKSLLLAVAGLCAVSGIVLPHQKELAALLRNRVEVVDVEALSGLELIDYVNNAQSLFKTQLSAHFAQFPEKTKMGLMGVKNVKLNIEDRMNEVTHKDIEDATVPVTFDARSNWPACPSIQNVRDQSACGSCWAFGAAEAMTDRICIASGGKTQVTISADDILSCCGMMCGNGCDGGYPIQAWKHWVSKGVVSGGNYTSKAGCKPYPFPPCEHHTNATHYTPCPSSIYPTDKCEHSCQSSYSVAYNTDKHYGSSAYAVSSEVAAIQKEIMTNGPVEVSFTVYEDFEHYTGGVYVHTAGKQLGGHAVKMIGWGVENGTPYWICTNSWNTDWGENGFFRIIRGVNECGIEGGVVGGIPKL